MAGSKYAKIDKKNIKAVAVCDRSGFIFNKDDLVNQKEWRGNSFVSTGWLVGKPFLDKPQPQNRIPKIKNDPSPVFNARLPEDYTDPNANPSLPLNELIDKLNTFNWGT